MLDKKYNFEEVEGKWQRFWEEEKIYSFDASSTKEIYSIDTPPPTVSGSLHIGHIFSYVQAEMIARFHRMQGKNVFYPFGFDDNGLPTERLVEKECGILAGKLPRGEFIDKCLATTEKYEAQFKSLWQSLGFSVDWTLQYRTISPQVQKISQKYFLDLVHMGKAYCAKAPVLWCAGCRTSIAQAELEAVEKEASFNWLVFKCGDEELFVATTRPEMLYGCVALFIHPGDARFNRYIGKNAVVPLYGFTIPILADEMVDMNKGTGIVMCATFGDTADLQWFKTHNLPYRKVIEPDGKVSAGVPFIGGLEAGEARREIIKVLREKGWLVKSEPMLHTVAVHERCGREIEIIPSRQWYIEILSKKDELVGAADRINWYPSYMKDRYVNWVRNLKWDWCVSRQRYFGIPLPIWYCNRCGAVKLADEGELPVNPAAAPPRASCPSCGGRDFAPETAVLDTWATSSLTPLINAAQAKSGCPGGKFLPMSMRTQAHEIIRTWAFYTILRSLYHTGDIPWRDMMVCGFVLAKKGEKISKSKNNTSLSPVRIIGKYSADAVRYWAANAKLGTDTMFSEEDLHVSGRFLTKLWNAARFCLLHLEGYALKMPQRLLPVDAWILARLAQTFSRAAGLLRAYEVGEARHIIDEFFWRDFCDNYLEIVKDRLYRPEHHSTDDAASACYAVYRCMLGILKLYAVFVPHITEEIYHAYFAGTEKEKSIHILRWDGEEEPDREVLQLGERLKEILAGVRRFKSARKISIKEPLARMTVFAPACELPLLQAAEKDLAGCTSAACIEFSPGEDFRVCLE